MQLVSTERREQIGVGCADIDEKAKLYVNDVLNNERLSHGPYSLRLENEFAKLHACSSALLVNSGTSALQLAVAALKQVYNWQDNEEILCPAVTFVASANVILMNNLKPVFVDVSEQSYNIDPAQIERHITEKTKAIMVVHLFGQPADMDPIIEIAKKYNLKIIEDSCETMFVKYKGRPVGSFGEISCFSTYMAHLITTGVGGLVCTSNSVHAETLKSLANHGRDSIYLQIDDDKNLSAERLEQTVARRFKFIQLGHSFRLTEMEAALGVAQLERKDEILEKRRENAQYLIEGLGPLQAELQLPSWPAYCEHAFMMFPLVIKKESTVQKKDLVMHLEKHNIETREMLPLTNQPFYEKMYGDLESRYPVARWINNNGFYIGCHQKLFRGDLDYIIKCFHNFFL
ncbi:MAG: DegT/DnrJ/EryC1/StrS family aminotransferase [bacterium]|nr:DegT/DnrJ/EryC1/StrS family aminotransferase [bacterium]